MMSDRLPLIDPATASPAVRAAFAQLPVVNVFRAMAAAETLYPAFAGFLGTLFQEMELDPRTERLAVLQVARLSDCHYVWRQNVVTARSLGIPDERIEALERGEIDAGCFTAEHTAALRFVQECVHDVEVGEAAFAAAARELSRRAIAELIYVTGAYMMICRFVRTGRVPLDERPGPSPYAG
ncbi:MAG: carboxymuconolactone decarboxylase family protein [Pseudonocardia sp.]